MVKILNRKITHQLKPLLLFFTIILLVAGKTVATAPNQENTGSKTNEDKSIRIGLLIPDEQRVAAKHGAQLAIQKANKDGGFAGIPFELVVKSTSGLWGTSSKKSVSLVFDDEVLAIMGSLDGRNAHLAEQVAAKTKLVYLSAWATEMSLSNAYVPWYFRVIPNDKQQAAALIEEICFVQKYKKVALIGTDKNDSELAVRTFIEEAKNKDATQIGQFKILTSDEKPFEKLPNFNDENFDAVVLIGNHEFASEIIPFIKNQNNEMPLFATLSTTDNQQANEINWKLLENVTVVASDFWFTENGKAFRNEFQKKFGYEPGPAAAYAFDGMNAIIEAVTMAKPALNEVIDDRDKLINAFSEMNFKNGITGNIQFDKNGNRINSVKLMKINDGQPVIFGSE